MKILLAILLGGFFGFALFHVEASSPKKILGMLRLEDLSLMKIIVFSIGFSTVLLALTGMLGIFNIDHLSIKTTHLGVLIGGLIFGLGFGGIGACPGTCVAAAGGDGIKKGIATILGGLFGAFVFAISYGFLDKIGLFSTMNLAKLTLFNLTDKFPSVLNIGFFGLFLMGGLFVVTAMLLPEKVLSDQ